MRNVIITGAASGVGKAVAEVLKNENLILVDIDEKNLLKVAQKLNKDYYICDVSKVEAIEKLLSQIKDKKIDCLINCAGMWISGDMSKTEEPLYKEMNELNRVKKVIDTNVFGTIAICQKIFFLYKK